MPYLEDFEEESTFSKFTVHDVHGDKSTFKYQSNWKGNHAVCQYGFTEPKDDWLVTPGIRLEYGKNYRLSFMLWTKGNLSETMAVKLGKGTAIEDMTMCVMDTTEISEPGTVDLKQTLEFYVAVPTDDVYYFGFHALTPGDPNKAFDIIIDDIKVEFVSLFTAPDSVVNLVAVPGTEGALEAEVSFTTPTQDGNGGAIASLTKAEIYCNGELAVTVDNPGVGENITRKVSTVQGQNEIMVKVSSEFGDGLESKISVYTGVVRPLPPTNVKARFDNGSIVLTWEAPETGVEGGYIDPSKLTYMVMRSDYTYVDEYVSGLTLTDDDIESFTSKDQAIVSYVVYAESAAGLGDGTRSNGVVVGEGTYPLPYKESFPNAFLANEPWGVASTTETSWYTTTRGTGIEPSDGDKGMMYFFPRGDNESSTIYTGRFCFNGTVNPMLHLAYWYNPEEPTTNKVNVQITKDYDTFVTIATLDYANIEASEGWNEFSVSLAEYIDEPIIALAFEGVSGNSEEEGSRVRLYLDNIRVSDYLDHNLRFNLFSAPGCVRFGENGNFSVSVENIGKMAASGYNVELYCNGDKVAEKTGHAIPVLEYEVIEFSIAPFFKHAPEAVYHAVINYDKDENKANNTSEEICVYVLVPDYPTAVSLEGKANGNKVSLTWTAPEETMVPVVTHESFEDYESFLIDNVGSWTLYDGDGGNTKMVGLGGFPVEFPHAGEPMAWMVWNAEEAGLGEAETGTTAFCANSGKQALIAFDAVSAVGQSDDWLISPELSGKAQTITFFVKTSVPTYGLQKYEVLYSLTGKEPQDFIQVEGTDNEAYWRWQEMVVNLPEGSRYFAIRNKSKSQLAIMLDDIRYIAASTGSEKLEIVGYNLYRDGKKINTDLLTETTCTDEISDEQSHTYEVTVVYRQGESAPSNQVSVAPNVGIGDVLSGKVSVFAGRGVLTLRGAAGLDVSVFRTDGRQVWYGVPSSASYELPLSFGVYVVKIGQEVLKVVVK